VSAGFSIPKPVLSDEQKDEALLEILRLRLTHMVAVQHATRQLQHLLADVIYADNNPDRPQVWLMLLEIAFDFMEADELAEQISGIRTHMLADWFGYSQESTPLLLGRGE
jgi:hypothetical protein